MRRKEEWHLWQNSTLNKIAQVSFSQLNSPDMGASPQSAIGTAFAFSRPSREALLLSNTSLLLEYTSRVFLDSLQE